MKRVGLKKGVLKQKHLLKKNIGLITLFFEVVSGRFCGARVEISGLGEDVVDW